MIWEALNRRWFADLAFCKLFKVPSCQCQRCQRWPISVSGLIFCAIQINMLWSKYSNVRILWLNCQYGLPEFLVVPFLIGPFIVNCQSLQTIMINDKNCYQFLQTFSLSSSNYMLVKLSWDT